MFTFDLNSGYHQIDVFQPHQCFLSFAFPIQGQMKNFSFTVLPFGLSTAPYCYTKRLRPVVGYLRSHGIKVTLFPDDNAESNHSFKSCKQDALTTPWKRPGLFPTRKNLFGTPLSFVMAWFDLGPKTWYHPYPTERMDSALRSCKALGKSSHKTTARTTAFFFHRKSYSHDAFYWQHCPPND